MDGVSHFGWEGQLYNGFPFTPSDQGFSNVGLEHIAEKGIFTRGVLVDLPSLYGIDSLEPGNRDYGSAFGSVGKSDGRQGVFWRCAVGSHRSLGLVSQRG